MINKFDQINDDVIAILSDPLLTSEEVMQKLHIGHATVSRWRKRLGITFPKGAKRGKSVPSRVKREERNCIICGSVFVVKPAMRKKICSIECSHIHLKSMDKSYMQTEDYKSTKRSPHTSAFRRYKNEVHRLTQKVYEANKDTINPNNLPRTLAGIEGGYQVDHIVSIKFGFDNNIPAHVLAEAQNLRMLPWKMNLARNRKHSNS